jgi:lipopolysaccharide export system protein LptC
MAALTFWLDRIVQPQPLISDRPQRHDPDFIIDGLFAVSMDAKGRARHTLFAQKMTHFPDDDTTLLVDPKFVIDPEAFSTVTVTARDALVSADGENIYFNNDVRVVRAPYAAQSELVLETNYLHVIPDDNIATTDQPVRINDANTVVTASGLELNSETRILNLRGRVRVIYREPSRAAQTRSR